MDYLCRHGIKNNSDDDLNSQSSSQLTLYFMPLPNMTRWNSWFKIVIYIYDYLDYIRGFYREEKELNSNKTIENIVSVFNDNNENGLTEIYLAFIHYHSRQFILDTKFFQKEKEPYFPLIEAQIEQLEAFLTEGMTTTNFGNIINNILSKYNTELSTFTPVFQAAYNFAFQKFSAHFSNYPSHSLFKAVRIFDPRYLKISLANRDIQKYRFNISQLLNPSVELLQEWSLYCNLDLNAVDFTNLHNFWEKMVTTLPLLSEIAFDYIWLPISSSAVECSFSVYNNLLSNKRQNLSTESLKKLNMMYFNNLN